MNSRFGIILLLSILGFFSTNCRDDSTEWLGESNEKRWHSLPVISISMNAADLFDDSAGIYVVGKSGATGYCNNALRRNYCQDLEKAAKIEYTDPRTGESYLSLAGKKIHGNCSRCFPQKSFALLALSKYGNDKFRHNFSRIKR